MTAYPTAVFSTMFNDLREKTLLTRVQRGYQAGMELRKKYHTAEVIQQYIEERCRHLNVRYYVTIRDNAFDATLLYTGRTSASIEAAHFHQKFRQYFEEQLLIYCYRNQTKVQQSTTRNGFGNLLNDANLAVRRLLMHQFSQLASHEVDDLSNDAVEIVLRRLGEPSFKLTSSLKTFLLETARHVVHQRLDEKNLKRKPLEEEIIETEADYQHRLIWQQILDIVQQYISQHGPSSCQAFLDVYWRLSSPFDFTDPITHRPVREDLVQERLGLTDEQIAQVKANTLKLSQTEALQLISGKTRRKQKVHDFYQNCVTALLHHIGKQINFPVLTQKRDALTVAEEKQVASFKKLLLKWIQTTQTSPTTIS